MSEGEMGVEAGHTLEGEELLTAIAAYLKPQYGSIINLRVGWEVVIDPAGEPPPQVAARCTFTKLE